jgi:hypothetical protein
MATVDDYITELLPKLALSPSLDVYKEMASFQTSLDFFGDKYDYALALRACHLYHVNTRGNANGGFITGMNEGRVGMSFWNSPKAGDNSGLSLSTYGQTLKGLIHSISAGVSGSGMYE